MPLISRCWRDSSAAGSAGWRATPEARSRSGGHVEECAERLVRDAQGGRRGFDVEFLLLGVDERAGDRATLRDGLSILREIRHATADAELRVLQGARAKADSRRAVHTCGYARVLAAHRPDRGACSVQQRTPGQLMSNTPGGRLLRRGGPHVAVLDALDERSRVQLA